MFRSLLLAFAICFSTGALADVIVMTNGDKLSGRLDSITGGTAILETPYAGVVRLDVVKSIAANRQVASQCAYPRERWKVTLGGRLAEASNRAWRG